MALYKVTNPDSPITAVEFTPVSDGNFTFFHVGSPDKLDEVKKWITSPEMGQQIVAETMLEGKPILVTQGDKPKEDIMNVLAAHGDPLEFHIPKKPFNFWFWRGALSMIGHPMNLVASTMGSKGIDFGVGLMAALNIAANFTNMTFGAQKSQDVHRLHDIKGELNEDIADSMLANNTPADVNENLSASRKEPELPKSSWQKFHDFMRRNSVIVGEIGLRYLGGISLVTPIDQWKKSYQTFAETGSLNKGFKAALNKDRFIALAGSFWLAGKTIAFFSKTPDPYDPKPKSTLETIREKYLFRASTLTEMAGAATLSVYKFNKGKIKWPNKSFIPETFMGKPFRGAVTRDYITTVGSALFMVAFGMRLFAPYGVKELNMEEVYAHATDILSKTPPDKLPQVMAEAAATLTENLKDQDVEFGEIYTKMMTDLYRYHHVAVNSILANPQNCNAPAPEQVTEQGKYTAANASRKTQDRMPIPAANFVDKAVKSSDGAALGLSA